MIADLHTHTWHSDGSLSPAELLTRAAVCGVDLLAITDHDCIGAYEDPALSTPTVPRVVTGIEFSTAWRSRGIHVVGLNVDRDDAAFRAGVAHQGAARETRARRIAERLAKHGIDDALAGARAQARTGCVGRPHFAAHLIETGAARDMKHAFRKYLGAGKAGDVRTGWADLATVIDWIRGAGGIAVLAHPAKYKLTRTKLGELVDAFAQAGGEAVEVISGQQTPDVTGQLTQLCQRYGLLASCGSDFHHPDQGWASLGRGLTLPAALTPVWSRW